METPDKLTLRDLVKSGGLYVLERRTAVQLREGDRVLYVPEGTSLDVDLDQVRDAVQVVTLEPSSMDGSLSVAVPGTNNTVTIPHLPGLYGVGQLPMGTNGREIHFYYMPPEGPIPEWRMREPSTVTAATTVNSYTAASATRPENPERDDFLGGMNVLTHDAARLMYDWMSRPELGVQKTRDGFFVIAFHGLWEEFFQVLVTQLKISGLRVDAQSNSQSLGPDMVLNDLYRILAFIQKERSVIREIPSKGEKINGELKRHNRDRTTTLVLNRA